MPRLHHCAFVTIAFVLACGLRPSPARADAIDGNWCLGTSQLHIEGPRITTPSGHQLEGVYSRHMFSYTVPASEAGAGSEIRMVLRGEELMELFRTPAATPETWRRCKPIS